MKTLLSGGLLVAGVLLISFALQAAERIGPGVFGLFTCSPTDRSIWALIAGMAAGTGGACGLLREPCPVPLP